MNSENEYSKLELLFIDKYEQIMNINYKNMYDINFNIWSV